MKNMQETCINIRAQAKSGNIFLCLCLYFPLSLKQNREEVMKERETAKYDQLVDKRQKRTKE